MPGEEQGHSVLLVRSSLHLGGIECQLLDHAHRLRQLGWRPCLLCLYRGMGEHPLVESARSSGFAAHTIPDPRWWSWDTLPIVREKVTNHRPNVIHSCDYRSDVLSYWGSRDTPKIAESHGHTGEGKSMSVWNRLDIWHLKRFSAVAAVSVAWETHLASQGVPVSKLSTVENSRAILLRSPIPEPAILHHSGPNLLFAGRLSPEKGLDVLLAAWPAILNVYPSAQLWVLHPEQRRSFYGAGLAGDMDQQNVHQIGYRHDIRPWLSAADITIIPSRQEAWGMTAFESLCLGTPVIATRVGGLAKICRSAPHAHLIPPENPSALIASLKIVLHPDYPRGSQVGEAYLAQPQFDPAARSRQLTKLYQAVLNG